MVLKFSIFSFILYLVSFALLQDSAFRILDPLKVVKLKKNDIAAIFLMVYQLWKFKFTRHLGYTNQGRNAFFITISFFLCDFLFHSHCSIEGWLFYLQFLIHVPKSNLTKRKVQKTPLTKT